MNYRKKYLSACIAALLVGASPAFAAAPSAPSLGAASSFTLLSAPSGFTTGGTAATGTAAAAGAVSCTDSIITGDVGSTGLLDSVTTTCAPVAGTGAIIAPVPTGVLTDFYAEYDRVQALACNQPLLTGTLDGAILDPGVYCFAAAAAPTGTLTLRGGSKATWVFKIGATAGGALSPTNFTVVMANGAASACNVTWWSQAATTIVGGAFKGIVLSGAGFSATGTATTGSTFDGQALAGRNSVTAGVTVTDMTVTGCEDSNRGRGNSRQRCNQGVGNGPEFCDPGNSNQDRGTTLPSPFEASPRSNDELPGAKPGNPGRKGSFTPL